MFFKSCIGFVLSNCVNEKNAYMFAYVQGELKKALSWANNTTLYEFALHMFLKSRFVSVAIKLFEIRSTQYSIELSVHKPPKVVNTTYTIQSRVNCPAVNNV